MIWPDYPIPEGITPDVGRSSNLLNCLSVRYSQVNDDLYHQKLPEDNSTGMSANKSQGPRVNCLSIRG